MTTIAASVKEGVMASDSKMLIGEIRSSCTKVFKVGKSLIGGAGPGSDINKFAEWIKECEKRPATKCPKLKDDFQGLMLNDEGLFYYDPTGERELLSEGVFAIGTGGSFALGALDAGASVQKAVEIAAERDSSSGSPVEVFHLREDEPKIKDKQ